MKIRTKISLVFLSAFIVVMIIVGVVTQTTNSRIIKDEVNRHLETTLQSRAHSINIFLKEQLEKIETAAIHQELLNEELKEIRDINEEFYEVFVIDSQGIIINSSNESDIGLDRSTDDYFVNARDKVHIKDAYFSKTTNQPSIAVSAPHAGGVLVAGIDLTVLNEITGDRTGLKETGELYLVNKDKYMITSSRFLEDGFLTQKVDTLATEHCFETHPQEAHAQARTYKDYRGVEVLGSHFYFSQMNWCLLAEIDAREALAPVLSILYALLGLLSALLIAYYLLSILLAKTITRPIEKLYQGVEIIGKGDLSYKVGTKAEDEIGQLSRAFDKTTVEIKKSRAEVDKKVKDQTKEIVEKQEALLNILEDVQKEKELTAIEKDKIATILYSIGDGVFVIDINHKILIFNQMASDISGFSAKEAIGKDYNKILNFVYEEDGKTINDEFIKKAIATGKIQEMTNHTVLIRKNGDRVAVADSAAPFRNKEGNIIGCVIVFRDVTKEREIDKMKTEFVSVASHQLRTPLTAIKWIIELFLEDKGLTSKQQERLTDVYSSNQQLIDLVGDLLNVSKMEAGKMVTNKKPVNIKQLIDNSIKILKANADKKKQKINFVSKAEIKETNIDSTLFNSAFNNLLSNAVAYGPPGSTIGVIVSIEGKEYVIEVHNDGPEISKSEQNKIFTKFWRGADAKRIKTRGTGLGLAIAKSAVEANSGKIWFKSGDGKGTSFYFTVPYK